MAFPDTPHGRAAAHAREVLAEELDPALSYHSLAHTAEEVVPAVTIIGRGEGVGPQELDLLTTAGWFHDIGFTVQRDGHEEVGASMAADALPGLGFSAGEVAQVGALIRATALPAKPQDLLQRIICDADLCNLGMSTFHTRSRDLRDELTAVADLRIDDAGWARRQADFLRQHRWWTPTAERLWAESSAVHLAELEARAVEGGA